MTAALRDRAAAAGMVTLALAPLDVALRVECPASAADLVAEACRGWGGAVGGPAMPLQLHIAPSRSLSGTGEVAVRVADSRITVSGPGATGHADIAAGLAECALSDAYLADAAALRQEVLEPLVLMMLTHRDRTPLHASAFIVDGVAILLAGHTGAGKSCLARAADAAGFQVLSDDTVFVQLAPRLRVWGWPTAAHLLAGDAPGADGPTRVRNGKVKQVVPLRSASQAAIACDRSVLCLLSPVRSGAPGLGPLPASAIRQRLWPLDEGFDLLPGPIARSLARLAARGVWDLRLSDDPAEAVRLLAASLPQLRATVAA